MRGAGRRKSIVPDRNMRSSASNHAHLPVNRIGSKCALPRCNNTRKRLWTSAARNRRAMAQHTGQHYQCEQKWQNSLQGCNP